MKPTVQIRLDAGNIVAFLGDIFTRRGGENYLGECVTMAEHMLQAAYLAEQRGESKTIIVAALLHDVGHFTGEFGAFSMNDTHDRYHEQAGARILEQFFPRAIAGCVGMHVAAKRYLCAVEPEYFGKLSPASVHSLRLQGGPMNAAEVAESGQSPHLQDALAVRRLDDAAKVAGLCTPEFDHYAPLIQSMVSAHCANTGA